MAVAEINKNSSAASYLLTELALATLACGGALNFGGLVLLPLVPTARGSSAKRIARP